MEKRGRRRTSTAIIFATVQCESSAANGKERWDFLLFYRLPNLPQISLSLGKIMQDEDYTWLLSPPEQLSAAHSCAGKDSILTYFLCPDISLWNENSGWAKRKEACLAFGTLHKTETSVWVCVHACIGVCVYSRAASCMDTCVERKGKLQCCALLRVELKCLLYFCSFSYHNI